MQLKETLQSCEMGVISFQRVDGDCTGVKDADEMTQK